MAERKNRFALISRFEKLCKINGYDRPTLNKHREQWAADDLLESWDDPQLYSAMEYYFKINGSPTWRGYCSNVDRLLQSIKAKEEDEKFRAQMRLKAREWLGES
jgi:hypothetical protein